MAQWVKVLDPKPKFDLQDPQEGEKPFEKLSSVLYTQVHTHTHNRCNKIYF